VLENDLLKRSGWGGNATSVPLVSAINTKGTRRDSNTPPSVSRSYALICHS
jgi:hypothetical protein